MNTTMSKRKKSLGEGEIIPLTFDPAFKLMWGNEEHPEVTALLISKLLKIPYEEVVGKVRFTQSRNQNLSVGDKQSDKDVTFIVDTCEPYKISLEMNFSPNALIYNNIIERNLYYLSNFFGTGLGQRSYKDLKTTIQFNFNMDFVDKEHKKLIDVYTFRNEEGHNMKNDEELCVLFYDKEEEKKKIWDSIREEYGEMVKKESFDKGLEQKEKEMVNTRTLMFSNLD